MKIALIMENSQAAKSALVESTLRKVVEPMGHEVVNYGMYAADDAAQLTYVQNGILAAVLLNSGAADYVITGCGTGEGAMLALNSFPGVVCGHVEDPEQRNKKILDGVRAIAFRDLNDILKDLPRDLVKGALSGEHFAEYFFPTCKDEKLTATVKELLA